jgi:hypothetical protein
MFFSVERLISADTYPLFHGGERAGYEGRTSKRFDAHHGPMVGCNASPLNQGFSLQVVTECQHE